MRKFALLGALLLTSASLSVPLSQTALAISCEGQIGCPIPKPQPPKQQQQPSSTRSTNHTGAWVVGCGIASASSLMIGTGDQCEPQGVEISATADDHRSHLVRVGLSVLPAIGSDCPGNMPGQ